MDVVGLTRGGIPVDSVLPVLNGIAMGVDHFLFRRDGWGIGGRRAKVREGVRTEVKISTERRERWCGGASLSIG